MIAQFTVIPLGTKTASLSKVLAKAVRPVAESGLDHRVGPMGTAIEGSWDEVLAVINLCREIVLKECPRVEILIFIDDRKNAKGRMEGKVRSLRKKAGVKLKE